MLSAFQDIVCMPKTLRAFLQTANQQHLRPWAAGPHRYEATRCPHPHGLTVEEPNHPSHCRVSCLTSTHEADFHQLEMAVVDIHNAALSRKARVTWKKSNACTPILGVRTSGRHPAGGGQLLERAVISPVVYTPFYSPFSTTFRNIPAFATLPCFSECIIPILHILLRPGTRGGPHRLKTQSIESSILSKA